MNAPAVGVIGLGEMGAAFARDLRASGRGVTGFDVDPTKMAASDVSARSSRDVVALAEIVFILLPSASALDAVMREITPALDRRHVVIDSGTTNPADDVTYAERCEARGARFVDAPITLREGRTFLLGGDPGARGRAVLDSIGRVVVAGPVGSGQRLKLVNQLLVFGQMVVQSEAVELCRRLEIDPARLRDELHWPINDRLIEPAGGGADQIPLVIKDTELIISIAASVGLKAPVAEMLVELYRAAGHGRFDEVARLWRD